MGFMKDLGRAAKERASRSARLNSLRTVIRCQERAAEKEYIALGRYYYNALRDKENPIAEGHCARIDEVQAQRDKALDQLQVLVRENSSFTVTEGADGPTAVFVATHKKPGTIFHFDKGPVEITIARDPEEHEEIDLSGVESFDQDPMPDPEFTPPADPPADQVDLPFEG